MSEVNDPNNTGINDEVPDPIKDKEPLSGTKLDVVDNPEKLDVNTTTPKDNVDTEASKLEDELNKERLKELDPFFTEESISVTQTHPVYTDLEFPKQFPIQMLPISASLLEKQTDKWPVLDKPDTNLDRLIGTIYTAASMSLPKGVHETLIEREGRDWQQGVVFDGKSLEVGSPAAKLPAVGQKLTGEAAAQAINQSMGSGTLIQTPLWHSGFWIWFRPPTTSELIELDENIAAEKVNLGRNKLGLPFGNSMVYIVNHLAQFVLDHIYDTTFYDQNREVLLKNIKLTDWFRIIHTLSTSIYPNGYSMEIPCVADIAQCTHVEKLNVNLNKLFWTDRSALTDEQKKHMSNRRTMMTKESIDAYLTTGRFNESRTVQITDNISLVLKVPSIAEYLEYGISWIDGIVQTVENMFTADGSSSTSREEKERKMLRFANATSLREFEHWIEKIIINGCIIEGVDIPPNLETISNDPDNATLLRKGVTEYIDDVTISVVATTRFKCPGCGNFSNKGKEVTKHPFLVPLDPSKLFFILGDRRRLRSNMS